MINPEQVLVTFHGTIGYPSNDVKNTFNFSCKCIEFEDGSVKLTILQLRQARWLKSFKNPVGRS